MALRSDKPLNTLADYVITTNRKGAIELNVLGAVNKNTIRPITHVLTIGM